MYENQQCFVLAEIHIHSLLRARKKSKQKDVTIHVSWGRNKTSTHHYQPNQVWLQGNLPRTLQNYFTKGSIPIKPSHFVALFGLYSVVVLGWKTTNKKKRVLFSEYERVHATEKGTFVLCISWQQRKLKESWHRKQEEVPLHTQPMNIKTLWNCLWNHFLVNLIEQTFLTILCLCSRRTTPTHAHIHVWWRDQTD